MLIQVLLSRKTVKANEKKGLLVLILQSFDRFRLGSVIEQNRSDYKIQWTPDNSNLQGKSKKVRVIGSSKKIAESKVKNCFFPHSEHFNYYATRATRATVNTRQNF